MAKTATTTSRSAFGFVPGNVATADDFQGVHEMQNAARALPVNLLCLQGEGQGWDGGSELAPSGSGVHFPSTGSDEVFRAMVYIDPDLVQIAVRTVVTLPASCSATVTVTVGGATATHAAHTAGTTSTANTNLNTSSTGTGWQLVTVDLQRDTGDPSTGTLDRCRIRSNAIPAASLADPV